jgi:hypothetical protein
VIVTWTGNLGEGTASYTAYSRDHHVTGGAKPTIPGTADPAFHGDPTRWNLLPGEIPAALPAFVGYGIAVQNLVATRELLERADFPVRESPLGGWYVPAEAALGAAVIFRSAHDA